LSRADDWLHEAHALAEPIHHRRAEHARRRDHTDDGLTAIERRPAKLWVDFRAVHAAHRT
jgi:hypothetical protein